MSFSDVLPGDHVAGAGGACEPDAAALQGAGGSGRLDRGGRPAFPHAAVPVEDHALRRSVAVVAALLSCRPAPERELFVRGPVVQYVGGGRGEPPRRPRPVVLDKDCLRPVGFEADEGLLPYSPRSFLGYRLLTELFVFPEKFLFVDFCPPSPRTLADIGNRLDLYFYLDREDPNLEHDLTADMFPPGCTPIVNLFSQRAEPIPLTHADFEYRVTPDQRGPMSHEVHGGSGGGDVIRAARRSNISRCSTAKHDAEAGAVRITGRAAARRPRAARRAIAARKSICRW